MKGDIRTAPHRRRHQRGWLFEMPFKQLINLFSIILLHLYLDHLGDLWYTFAWSLGGGGTTWSRVLALINKSGAGIKPALKKETCRPLWLNLKVTKVTMESGSSFPIDELQLDFTDQQIQVYLQMIPICDTYASLNSVIIHSLIHLELLIFFFLIETHCTILGPSAGPGVGHCSCYIRRLHGRGQSH